MTHPPEASQPRSGWMAAEQQDQAFRPSPCPALPLMPHMQELVGSPVLREARMDAQAGGCSGPHVIPQQTCLPGCLPLTPHNRSVR